MAVTVTPFGALPTGKTVRKYAIVNKSGAVVELCEYGARIVSIKVPDMTGALCDVALGYDDVSGYLDSDLKMGAVCGRVACRIADGSFAHDGTVYKLSQNDGSFTLHGGFEGFDAKLWSGCTVGENSVVMTYVSVDGEEGFPGTLAVNVIYTFDDDNTLTLDYRATTDKDTICSLTNHAYFNLAGHDSGNMLNQKLKVEADFYCENDIAPILNGSILPVKDTALDFRRFREIGERIDTDFEQVRRFGGYNHTYALRKTERGKLETAAVLCDETSGIVMDVLTTMPGLHIFSSNRTQTHTGKNGAEYGLRGGICFETMYFNNAFKCPWFPSPLLKKEDAYRHRTQYKFSVNKK